MAATAPKLRKALKRPVAVARPTSGRCGTPATRSSSASTRSAGAPGPGRSRSAPPCCRRTGGSTRSATPSSSPRPSARRCSTASPRGARPGRSATPRAEECDELGMCEAQRLAARRASTGLGVPARPGAARRQVGLRRAAASPRRIVKGDARCLSIAAASILAKVTRDRIMRAEAEHYPGCDFDLNKGYPCPRHKAALRGVGPVGDPPPQLGVHGHAAVGRRASAWCGPTRRACCSIDAGPAARYCTRPWPTTPESRRTPDDDTQPVERLQGAPRRGDRPLRRDAASASTTSRRASRTPAGRPRPTTCCPRAATPSADGPPHRPGRRSLAATSGARPRSTTDSSSTADARPAHRRLTGSLGMRRRPFALALVAWTFFVWTTRIGNIWRDADLDTGDRSAAPAWPLSFTLLAVGVLAGPLARVPTALGSVAVGALAAWSTAVWVVRDARILVADHEVGVQGGAHRAGGRVDRPGGAGLARGPPGQQGPIDATPGPATARASLTAGPTAWSARSPATARQHRVERQGEAAAAAAGLQELVDRRHDHVEPPRLELAADPRRARRHDHGACRRPPSWRRTTAPRRRSSTSGSGTSASTTLRP